MRGEAELTSRVGSTIAECYVLDAEIGRGAMSTVYSATHVLTGKPVAVKVIEAAADQAVAARLVEEARSATRLRHKNLVEVLDAGVEADGSTYLILELLNGETLEMVLAKAGTLVPEETFNVLMPVLNAVAAFHRQGIIHRDIKPANIYLHRDPKDRLVPKLLDLGIAKEIGPAGLLAKDGTIAGAPHYLAPEQVGGGSISTATDVWAVGVVLYRCLSGQYAFSGDSAVAVMTAIGTGRIKPLHKAAPGIPVALCEAIERAIVVEAQDRPQDMDGFLRALHSAQHAPQRAEGSRAKISPLPPQVVETNEGERAILAFTGIGLGAIGVSAWLLFGPTTAPLAELIEVKKAPPVPTSTIVLKPVFIPEPPPQVKEEPKTITLVERSVAAAVQEPPKDPPVEPPKVAPVEPPKKSGKQAYERALAAKKRGDNAAAIRALGEAIALSPDFVAAYNTRGLLHQANNKLEEAIADFTQAIRLEPGNASLYNNRALAKKARGETASAIEDLNRAIELQPSEALFYLHRGQTALAKNDRVPAVADFTKAIEKGEVRAHFYRGIALQEAAEHEKAIADLDRALKLDARAEVYYRRGRSQLELGRAQAAVDDFDRALQKDPKHASSYLRRGLAYAKLDRKVEAQRDLRRFLELDPKSPSRESIRKQLEKLEKP
jgi:serine/threonine-protein kinase